MNNHHYNHEVYESDDITLKDFLLKLQKYFNELKRSKFTLVLSMIFFSGLFCILHSIKPVTFTTAMSFMVNETENNRVMGSPFDEVYFEGIKNHKLIKIARSSKIVHQVLFTIDSSSGLTIAEKLVNTYKLKESWNDIDWADVGLSSVSQRKYSRRTSSVIGKLHEFLVGNKLNDYSGDGLISVSYDIDSELFNITVQTIDPSLSSELLEKFYKTLSDFYIDKTVGKPQRIFKQLKSIEDSLRTEVNMAESSFAYSADRTRGVNSSVAKVNQNRLRRKLDQITETFDETRTNRQKIEYILQTETPDFQIIDQTFIPISSQTSIVKKGLLGSVIGAICALALILIRLTIREALEQ